MSSQVVVSTGTKRARRPTVTSLVKKGRLTRVVRQKKVERKFFDVAIGPVVSGSEIGCLNLIPATISGRDGKQIKIVKVQIRVGFQGVTSQFPKPQRFTCFWDTRNRGTLPTANDIYDPVALGGFLDGMNFGVSGRFKLLKDYTPNSNGQLNSYGGLTVAASGTPGILSYVWNFNTNKVVTYDSDSPSLVNILDNALLYSFETLPAVATAWVSSRVWYEDI